MPEYLTPDVYVEEVPAGPRPIQAVGTRTAAFVGVAPTGRSVGRAVAVNNWLQFTREFVDERSTSTNLSNAVFGFFQNGGSRCFVTNIRQNEGVDSGLRLLEAEDEVAIVAAPGFADAASYEAVLTHCELLKDRVAILDAPAEVGNIGDLTKVATATRRKGVGEPETSGLRPRQSEFGAFYFPWITARDPLGGELVDIPPSGHIAGIWARNDAARGVHKAPANEPIRGALNLTYRMTQAEQGTLNPMGINCIRFFSREGIRVWGARTLADASSEWRYLNVRRLFNMIEESIAEATRWIVFEPNNRELWKSIRRDISAFLTRVWRDGALLGRTAQEAFFVKCDEETNPPEVIDAGMVIAIIGIAPVKPAEFVIFKISQHAGGVEIEAEV
jgi:phage tail sheath protein FI